MKTALLLPLLPAALALVLAGCETPVRLVRADIPAQVKSADSADDLATARRAWLAGDEAAGNAALARLLRFDGGAVSVKGAATSWEAAAYPAGYFDRIESAYGATVRGMSEHAKTDGWGVPLIAWRENRHRESIEKFYPPEGIARPLTAVLEFPTDGGAPRLRVLDPFAVTEISLPGQRRAPLAADFSAPYIRLLERAQGGLMHSSIAGFLTANGLGREPGFALLQPYDPRKTPVIMVHGLLSSPLIWREMTTAVWAEPDLRARFQVWHYFYPTSYPYLHSASQLRDNLHALRQQLGASRDPAAPVNHAVVIAHSLGGLITHTLVSSSKFALWDAAFTRRPEKLTLPPELDARLRRYFLFEPEPTIRRVVFIAVPHRGSMVADSWIGAIGRALARVPANFLAVFRTIEETNPGSLGETMLDMARGHATSVRVLSQRNPIRDALAELPVSPRVPFHTILGNQTGRGPVETSSDGVVPYTSGHLDGAASELVIHAPHDEPHRPAAVAEVKRILREAESRKTN